MKIEEIFDQVLRILVCSVACGVLLLVMEVVVVLFATFVLTDTVICRVTYSALFLTETTSVRSLRSNQIKSKSLGLSKTSVAFWRRRRKSQLRPGFDLRCRLV